ncbi:MAG: hypothetical protein Q8K21_17810 [Hydrogenophaga sp.]|uniref:hypothetical protein n=1 Tax=Hydrogenophaga sp. TaxID=1904254 RepID=UPI00272F44AD|nr:hypothetical protein [Hydrogenophaga sp.]MDP2166040.1 hypothetical protein [Hydrogenophaga sp.]MDP3477653.1 hypothetical protein [Hydrogenophaga sp.]
MTLTRDFKQTVIKRAQRDPAFAKALLDAAAALFLSGGPDTARLILRDRVNATVGFEQLTQLTQLTRKPSKRCTAGSRREATPACTTWPRSLMRFGGG